MALTEAEINEMQALEKENQGIKKQIQKNSVLLKNLPETARSVLKSQRLPKDVDSGEMVRINEKNNN